MSQRIKIFLGVGLVAVLIIIASGFYYFQQQGAKKIIQSYYHGQKYKIEKISSVFVKGKPVWRAKISFPNGKLLGVCGKIIKFKDEIIYIQNKKILSYIPESEVKNILKKYGIVEKIKRGNFQINNIDGQCQLNNIEKVIVKLKEKQAGKYTHREFYINQFGNIFYSRPMFMGKTFSGESVWTYGSSK